MIKFECEGVAGFVPAIRGMRNPKNSWDKSDSIDCTKYINCQGCQLDGTDCHSQGWFMLGENDRQLALILANAGTDHGKFLRMINVCIDITAPFYWWKEFDTYRMGVEKNSCSTMHKLASRDLTIDDFSVDHLDGDEIIMFKNVIDILNYFRAAYKKTGEKSYWYKMIQLLPNSYNQKRTCVISYAALRNMYHARKNHKLDEWRAFCRWVEELPHSDLITGVKNG